MYFHKEGLGSLGKEVGELSEKFALTSNKHKISSHLPVLNQWISKYRQHILDILAHCEEDEVELDIIRRHFDPDPHEAWENVMQRSEEDMKDNANKEREACTHFKDCIDSSDNKHPQHLASAILTWLLFRKHALEHMELESEKIVCSLINIAKDNPDLKTFLQTRYGTHDELDHGFQKNMASWFAETLEAWEEEADDDSRERD